MNISIQNIEDALGFSFPDELAEFYTALSSENKEEYIFKVSHLTKNWIFRYYNFWILMTDINDITYLDIYKRENTNKISIINASNMMNNDLNENVLCFAWSHDCVERDTGIFYKPDGKIYGYSGNFSDEGKAEYLADSLIDLLYPKKLKKK